VNLPFFIARRYLFARKSHNVINIISAISVAGIALASMALICTLSVFNGFHDLVSKLFTNFDAQLKVVPAHGKVLDPQSSELLQVYELAQVDLVSEAIEEQALIQYKNKQEIVTVKGVSDNFHDLASVENTLRGQGIYMLHDDVAEYGILGIGLVNKLDCGIQSVLPFSLHVPKRGVRINPVNPTAGLQSAQFFSPGVIFQVDQAKYDDGYVLVSLDLARTLFGYDTEASAIEIRLTDDANLKRTKKQIQQILGSEYKVLDRYEQQADVFKVVKLEKFISYLFLSFILLIACFNIIGSLIMLIVEKQQDSTILGNLGLPADDRSRIFVYDGLLISFSGAVAGLIVGIILVLLQQKFGFVPLGQGTFIVDYYPVSLHLIDIVTVLITVLAVSFISVRPIGRIASKYIDRKESQD